MPPRLKHAPFAAGGGQPDSASYGCGVTRFPSPVFARVYALVRRIPRGRVASYGSIARALGMPRGARTVGWALAACGDDVPWHRVVNAQGKISWRPTGGYHLQRARLHQEGVRFARGRVDLEKFGWKKL